MSVEVRSKRALRAPIVMRKIENAFGLKMDVWAHEVIDEAILSRGTVAHNHLVGLTGRCPVFSNPFKRQGQFDYSSLIDNRCPLHRAVYEAFSSNDACLNDAGRFAVLKDTGIGMEPDLRRFASDGSHVDVRLGTDENVFCSDGGIRRADREEGCECKNSNDVGL